MRNNIIKGIVLFSILVIGAVMLTGCGKKVELDLAKVKTDLSTLKSDGFSMMDVETSVTSLESDEVYALEFVYNLKDYGITDDNIDEYRFYINPDNKDFYAVIKPVEGKSEDVRTEMNAFIEKMKADEDLKIVSKYSGVLKEEFEGNQIYIATTTLNNQILEKIKSAKAPILSMMQEVTTETMESIIGIQPSDVQEFLMEMPMMIVKSSTYIIVKPAEGQIEKVKTAINDYMGKLEEQWSTYLPEQYEIVKNRMETQLGDYLIYIATTDNNKVLETIKNAEIK